MTHGSGIRDLILECPECHGDTYHEYHHGPGREAGYGYAPDVTYEPCRLCNATGRVHASEHGLLQSDGTLNHDAALELFDDLPFVLHTVSTAYESALDFQRERARDALLWELCGSPRDGADLQLHLQSAVFDVTAARLNVSRAELITCVRRHMRAGGGQ